MTKEREFKMDRDINFTDEQGNEFFVKVREGKVDVFKNKTEITDVRFYVDELEE
jgi:hypothetical protein